jgi:hypothetical protein
MVYQEKSGHPAVGSFKCTDFYSKGSRKPNSPARNVNKAIQGRAEELAPILLATDTMSKSLKSVRRKKTLRNLYSGQGELRPSKKG